METNKKILQAQEYNTLYCKAFAHLDELCSLAERAMSELEELQLSMAEEAPFSSPRFAPDQGG